MLVHYQWCPSQNQEFVGPCSNLTRHKIDLTWQLWIVNHWGFRNFRKFRNFPSVKKSYLYYDYRSNTNSSFSNHSINFNKRIEKEQNIIHFIHQSCKSESDSHPHKTLFDTFWLKLHYAYFFEPQIFQRKDLVTILLSENMISRNFKVIVVICPNSHHYHHFEAD